MASDLPLAAPEAAVGVEDASAEELLEDGPEPSAFYVVGEVGAEELLHVGRIGGADAAGEAEEAVDLEGEGGRVGEHFGDPVVEAVAVAEESD